jgi:hypothetical protein
MNLYPCLSVFIRVPIDLLSLGLWQEKSVFICVHLCPTEFLVAASVRCESGDVSPHSKGLLLAFSDRFDLGGEVDEEGPFVLVEELLFHVVFLEDLLDHRLLVPAGGP